MTADPAGMAAADPANPQSWNRYAYVMNNPLNATDPLGLCYFGDGHTIGTTYPGRVIGEECNSGALDSDQPCENSITDASCPGTPVGPGPDPAGTPDSYFNSFIVQSHDQDLADYQGTVDCGYNPGTCDPSKKPAGYIILVICGGSSTDITCLPPDEAALGSFGFRTNALYPGLAPGDVPAGAMAQQLFQGNRSTWRGAYQVGEGAFIGTAAVPLGVMASPYIVDAAVLGAQYGRTPQVIGAVGDFIQGMSPGMPPMSWAAFAGEVVSNWSNIKQEFKRWW